MIARPDSVWRGDLLRNVSWLLFLFALFFGIRLVIAMLIDASVPVLKDADAYAELASTLAVGKGFVMADTGAPILWRAPLYPLFLSTVVSAAGSLDPWAVLVAQCAIDAASALLAYWIGQRLFNRRVGVLGALLFSLYPLSAYYTLRFMPEPLFAFFITGAAASLVWAIDTRRVAGFAVAGALIGSATLVKPSALALAPFLAIVIPVVRLVGARGFDWQGAAIRSGVLLAFFAFTLGPWTYRNYLVTGHFVPATTGGGYSFWLGNNPVSDGMEDREIVGDEARLEAFLALRNSVVAGAGKSVHAYSPEDEATFDDAAVVDFSVDLDRAFYSAGIRQILSHPAGALALAIKKAVRFWFKIFMPHNQWASAFVWAAQAFILALFIIGLVEIGVRHKLALPVIATMGYFLLLHTATLSAIRYSIPLLPLVAPFAAGGLVISLQWILQIQTRAERA